MDNDRRLMLKIAHCYYIQGMTQSQIAEKLSMSRQRVNRIIGSLVDKGIVTIKINGYEESCLELEEMLENKFNLKQAIVTEVDGENVLEKLGAVTAEYLTRTLKDTMNICVSWGKTLSSVVHSMPTLNKGNISIVQCVGGKNVRDTSIMTDEITRVLANKLNATSYFLYAPAIVKDKNTKKIIMNEETVKNVFNMMNKCDMALVGIGSLNESSTLYEYGFLTKEEIDILRGKGCVGDMCFIPFDADGNTIETDLRDRIIGIDAQTLKNIPMVVGIAGGEGKEKAVLGALKTGFLDVLITDKKTAEYILDSI